MPDTNAPSPNPTDPTGLQADPDAEALIGHTLDNVHIESLIAVGGMGVIYLGKEELTDRKVAVKILRPERQRSDRDREYFVREAQALSQIRHPNLVELYRVGTTNDNRHYMILEYVPGRTLREIVEAEGALEPLRCIRLFRQLLLALEATHAHGILHRDLKPDNLLIEALTRGKERLRLADLGLVKFIRKKMARLTDIGMTVGTPCYMSPEQVRGMELDPRSDLYTTGVLMFEALTTYLPYPRARDVEELLDHILEAEPAHLTRANPQFSRLPGVQVLLDRLLAKDPAQRPATAAEVISQIDQLLETELSGDVRAALKEHEARYNDDGSFQGALRSEVEMSRANTHIMQRVALGAHIDDGLVIAFRALDRRTGQDVPPPPHLVRRLRAWVETAGAVLAAERNGGLVAYGVRRASAAQRMAVGLPWLVLRAPTDVDHVALCAALAWGSFRVEQTGQLGQDDTPRRALELVSRANPGQVLIEPAASAKLGIDKAAS